MKRSILGTVSVLALAISAPALAQDNTSDVDQTGINAQAYVDQCVTRLNAGELTAAQAAQAKLWCTELQQRTVDRCLQLHGGYGYMREYPIARAFVDARVQTIYGGANDVMRDLIGRRLVGPARPSGRHLTVRAEPA